MKINQNDIRIPTPRINVIVNGKRAITADTVLRLKRRYDLSDMPLRNLKGTTPTQYQCAKPLRQQVAELKIYKDMLS